MTPEEYLAALVEWAEVCERYATKRIAGARAARALAERYPGHEKTNHAAMTLDAMAETARRRALEARAEADAYRLIVGSDRG